MMMYLFNTLYVVNRGDEDHGSARLEEQNGDLSHVEIDEMLGFVGDIGTEVAANNTMPGRIIFLVEFLLDVGGDVFFDVEFLKGNVGTVNSVLLHFLIHVSMLDHCFPFGC